MHNNKICGYLNIFPEIIDADTITISIVGDPKGLKSLAKLLNTLAEINQDDLKDLPIGEREHIHIHKEELGGYSCNVEICRADAKGTKQLLVL